MLLQSPVVDTVQIIVVVLVVALVAGAGWFVTTRRRAGEIEEVEPSRPARVATAPPGLGTRLGRTSESLGGALRRVFVRAQIDSEFWEGMEEALIAADVGVEASSEIVDRVKGERPESVVAAREALRRQLVAEMAGRTRSLRLDGDKPAVVLIVGVNGSGKTTSIAKLAHLFKSKGDEPLLGAADTFRAAADAQLRTWGDRLGVEVVGGQEGSDPASVAFDSFAAARARGRDVVIVDTAGRLHSKNNLMAELSKIKRVLEREAGSVDEVLLVLDATAGQNGIRQVEEFTSAVGVTGIVLTKLDGTARGGVVVAVERQLDVPVKFIGVGEGVEDMLEFVPTEFVDALLAEAQVRG